MEATYFCATPLIQNLGRLSTAWTRGVRTIEEEFQIKEIDREELKGKLERGDDFTLAMVLGEWTYRAKHIPGSLNVTTLEVALEIFDPEDEIIVYCSGDP